MEGEEIHGIHGQGGRSWTADEDEELVKRVRLHGRDWSAVWEHSRTLQK